MLTLRRYFNGIDAGLAKAYLDDHDIFCSLFDQDAQLYTGAYTAIPVRLVVSGVQFKRAARLLAYSQAATGQNGYVAVATEREQEMTELDQEIVAEEDQREFEETLEANNPWEILAIAYLFFVPGLGFLLEKRPLILLIRKFPLRSRWSFLVLSPTEVHFVGALLITTALLITLSYFYTRRLIAHDNQGDSRD